MNQIRSVRLAPGSLDLAFDLSGEDVSPLPTTPSLNIYQQGPEDVNNLKYLGHSIMKATGLALCIYIMPFKSSAF